MPESLTEVRLRAARCSGGNSSDSIKRLVLRMLREHRIEGRVLDFAAGTGALINLIGGLDGIELHGADILPRPADISRRCCDWISCASAPRRDFRNPDSFIRTMAGCRS